MVDGSLSPELARLLNDGIDQGLRQSVDAMTPRVYVELVTMSTFEIGLSFKRALRDELYERRRERQGGTVVRRPD